MDEDELVGQLPLAYAAALRMQRRGIAADVIAEVLGIAPESVSTLLDVGRAKLERLRDAAGQHRAPSPAPG